MTTENPRRKPPADAGLLREHRRLRRAFTALLLTLAPAAAAEACGDPAPPEVMPGNDAGSSDGDAAPPDGDAAPLDAGEDSDCKTVVTTLDAGIDGDPSCLYALPCGLPSYLTAVGCDLYAPDDAALGCRLAEGEGCSADVFVPGPSGEVQIYCLDCLGSGRRPRGLAKVREIGAPSPLGAYFARAAHDEAAAVHAFRRLRDELALHGAPPALVSAADRSARDEERHARAMARRARMHHAPIPSPRLRRWGLRSLEAIARENAVEGCVLETFGALIMGWQAAHARDASLRRTFARIAADETRHAALAWAVARWALDHLDPGARARVAAAERRALRSLLRPARPSLFDAELGRPSPERRAALLDGMIHRLGS